VRDSISPASERAISYPSALMFKDLDLSIDVIASKINPIRITPRDIVSNAGKKGCDPAPNRHPASRQFALEISFEVG
jgi:hypothetical protein